jgi:hypothetical protein
MILRIATGDEKGNLFHLYKVVGVVTVWTDFCQSGHPPRLRRFPPLDET